jgi:hypothetical protein
MLSAVLHHLLRVHPQPGSVVAFSEEGEGAVFRNPDDARPPDVEVVLLARSIELSVGRVPIQLLVQLSVGDKGLDFKAKPVRTRQVDDQEIPNAPDPLNVRIMSLPYLY